MIHISEKKLSNLWLISYVSWKSVEFCHPLIVTRPNPDVTVVFRINLFLWSEWNKVIIVTRAGSLAVHRGFVLITKLESLSVSLSVGLSFYLSEILSTFLTTFVLITKLKSRSVFYLSVCLLSVCLSVSLSFYLSDIPLTFWTTFILITKLKSLSVLYLSFCQSVCLSVCLSVCISVFLSFWHPVDILNNFCFDE